MKVDSDSMVITDYSVTDAAVHDSKRFVGFIKKGEDKNVYADSIGLSNLVYNTFRYSLLTAA